ncbi:MAG: hypothetical protein V1917_00180 [Candidatus Gottesmanbacteria bacterium]
MATKFKKKNTSNSSLLKILLILLAISLFLFGTVLFGKNQENSDIKGDSTVLNIPEDELRNTCLNEGGEIIHFLSKPPSGYSFAFNINRSEVCYLPTTTSVSCVWCGLNCVDKATIQMCAMIAPPNGYSCVNKNNVCTKVGGGVVVTPRPTPPPAVQNMMNVVRGWFRSNRE